MKKYVLSPVITFVTLGLTYLPMLVSFLIGFTLWEMNIEQKLGIASHPKELFLGGGLIALACAVFTVYLAKVSLISRRNPA